MQFEENAIYHIYNQGNNRREVFVNRENYLYFLRKMRSHICPYGDFICYCLMPNHFHWLFQVRTTVQPLKALNPKSKRKETMVLFNDAIGIMLRSYSQAINKQEGWSGSLFRPHTKAEDGFIEKFITVDSRHWGKEDYAAYCFGYIHRNPTEAGLVVRDVDWEFSSARDYAGLRNGALCNLELGREILGRIYP